jgi:hypothetical protein
MVYSYKVLELIIFKKIIYGEKNFKVFKLKEKAKV